MVYNSSFVVLGFFPLEKRVEVSSDRFQIRGAFFCISPYERFPYFVSIPDNLYLIQPITFVSVIIVFPLVQIEITNISVAPHKSLFALTVMINGAGC